MLRSVAQDRLPGQCAQCSRLFIAHEPDLNQRPYTYVALSPLQLLHPRSEPFRPEPEGDSVVFRPTAAVRRLAHGRFSLT